MGGTTTGRAAGNQPCDNPNGCPGGPSALDHRTLRRFLAYLDTRGFARSTIARKAAALRAFLRFLRRRGVLERDLGSLLRAPKGASRLPRVIRTPRPRKKFPLTMSASASSGSAPSRTFTLSVESAPTAMTSRNGPFCRRSASYTG